MKYEIKPIPEGEMKKCKFCGGKLVLRLRPDTPHYGELWCVMCKRHNKWVSNPDNGNNGIKVVRKYTVREVAKFHNMKKPRCFFCLRTKDELGQNETLTIDHIVELQMGGKDKLENLQILCSACHSLKNWTRLYINWHINGKGGDHN